MWFTWYRHLWIIQICLKRIKHRLFNVCKLSFSCKLWGVSAGSAVMIRQPWMASSTLVPTQQLSFNCYCLDFTDALCHTFNHFYLSASVPFLFLPGKPCICWVLRRMAYLLSPYWDLKSWVYNTLRTKQLYKSLEKLLLFDLCLISLYIWMGSGRCTFFSVLKNVSVFSWIRKESECDTVKQGEMH